MVGRQAERARQRCERQEPLGEPPELSEGSRQPIDPSFGLFQLLVDLKGAVGEVEEAIRTLQKDSEKQGDKLSTLSHQIYAAWAVTLVVFAVAGFFIDKFWDSVVRITEVASRHR